MYLWLKFFHIFFIIAWFAGLFYLPRIYVNLALAQTPEEYSRLLIMAQKLYKFMTPWGIGALIFGTLMLAQLPAAGWTHGKLTIGILLAAYHIACRQLLIALHQQRNRHSHKWSRVFNEIPVFPLLAALYLVLFQPF